MFISFAKTEREEAYADPSCSTCKYLATTATAFQETYCSLHCSPYYKQITDYPQKTNCGYWEYYDDYE